jgi:CheY-like chemotaxis protein
MSNNNITEWSSKTILIAEDLEINFKFIEIVVSKTKAKILRATNGQEAIDICRGNSGIDMVLMDIMMPEVDGITATNEIKKFRNDLPIIALTAHGNEIEKELLDKVAFDGFFTKPIKLDDVVNILNKFFNK